MKKLVLLIVIALMLTSCNMNIVGKVSVNDETYKCSDIEKGIFTDKYGNDYKITYTVKDGKYISTLVECK